MWILEVCLAYTIGLGCTASRAEVFPDLNTCFEELKRQTKDSPRFMPRGMTEGGCYRLDPKEDEQRKPRRVS